MTTIDGVLEHVTRIAATPGVGLRDLAAVAAAVDLPAEVVDATVRTDDSKPYGRRVLLANHHVESMIARWTRGIPCAPHDHGGSYGAVRLLQGSAKHTVWHVREGELVRVRDDVVHAGEVLTCGPDMVHSMVDAGGELPLTTLHLYIDPIDHMFVYEQDRARTWVVDGGCGAWLPHDQPELVREIHEGILRPRDVRATWAIGA